MAPSFALQHRDFKQLRMDAIHEVRIAPTNLSQLGWMDAYVLNLAGHFLQLPSA